jgi:hypothetical protein
MFGQDAPFFAAVVVDPFHTGYGIPESGSSNDPPQLQVGFDEIWVDSFVLDGVVHPFRNGEPRFGLCDLIAATHNPPHRQIGIDFPIQNKEGFYAVCDVTLCHYKLLQLNLDLSPYG